MTSNKNLNTIINMNGNVDDKVTFLQKRKTLYENKIFGFLKDVIKSRKSLRTAEQNYNKKQTKANKNKVEDKKLDYEENSKTLLNTRTIILVLCINISMNYSINGM